MHVEAQDSCFGCYLCEAKCPRNAISMQYGPDGFLVPRIDASLCNDCNICDKLCLINNSVQLASSDFWFLAENSDEEIKCAATSGGIFFALAEHFIYAGGYVCAAMVKDGVVKHAITDSIAVLKQMMGTRYVQSELGKVFIEIKSLINADKAVMFIGTPCQNAALKRFFNKGRDNLLQVDIICHGVPSFLQFEYYLQEMKLKDRLDQIVELNFRKKSIDGPLISFETESKSRYSNKISNELFCKAYFENLLSRSSCFRCDYCSLDRVGDITIGDAWCVKWLFPELDINRGLSQISCNTKKGSLLINNLIDDKKIKLFRKISKEEAVCGNPNLTTPSTKNPFWDDVQKSYGMGELSKSLEYYSNKNRVGILNFSFENNNYGAILTSYALQKVIEELGYPCKVINYIPSFSFSQKVNDSFISFKKRFLNLTDPITSIEELAKLNQYFDIFITGSDQVFRPKFNTEGWIYLLSFVDRSRKKISYAASFGVGYFEGDAIDKLIYKCFLSEFDHISVREKAGVDIMKEDFDLDSKVNLDPVFLLSDKDWGRIAVANEDQDFYNVSYILDETLRTEVNAHIENCTDIRFNLCIENWLSTIKDAKLVITDSYHCVCFCIIFRKKFILVVTDDNPIERIYSLFDMLRIPRSKILNCKDGLSRILDYAFEYDNYSLLDKYIHESTQYLRNSLMSENDVKNVDNRTRFRFAKLLKTSCSILRYITFGKIRRQMKDALNKLKNFLLIVK